MFRLRSLIARQLFYVFLQVGNGLGLSAVVYDIKFAGYVWGKKWRTSSSLLIADYYEV